MSDNNEGTMLFALRLSLSLLPLYLLALIGYFLILLSKLTSKTLAWRLFNACFGIYPLFANENRNCFLIGLDLGKLK